MRLHFRLSLTVNLSHKLGKAGLDAQSRRS
jgi:hypothetical protein